MKKIGKLKLFGLVFILMGALIFIRINYLEAKKPVKSEDWRVTIQQAIDASSPGDTSTAGFADKAPDDGKKAKVLKQAYHIQVPFIENMGQVKSKDVSFYAKTFGGTIFVEKSGALTYNLPAKDKGGVVIKEIFTEKRIKVEGLKPSSTNVNYFIGKEKRGWKTNIPSYESISLGEVYKGIDLTLKAYGNNVEKLFTVLPEGNPEVIRVKMAGAKGLSVSEKGELEVITELGSVRFTKPIAYQKIAGEKQAVELAYAIYEGNTYGFKVGNYDEKRPLIIDPLLASTFIGGGGYDTASSIAFDGTGNLYVAGASNSSDFPTTPGAYDESDNSGVFVSKLDSNLSTLLASALIGGSGGYGASCIVVDAAGNVYVAGYTDSSDYPTTPGAYDESYNGGAYDAIVSKFDSDLSTLLASTFIGGSGYDDTGCIVVDAAGNVYVTGGTGSPAYPTTPGAYDESYNGTENNVFVSRLDSNLSTLLSSTFIGGGGWSWATGTSIVLDGVGNVYITGGAGFYWGTPYPTTPGAYDESHNGDIDFFVSKLDPELTSLLASTFIGGFGRDVGRSIVFDGTGNVYVAGAAGSPDYPTTPGAYDESYNGVYDFGVSKLDSNLSTLLASTFIGGDNKDIAKKIAIDGAGNVYVAGYTGSADYPTTPGAYDESYNGGEFDFVVSRFDSTLSYLQASTFIGGFGKEVGRSIGFDGTGNVYVVGDTGSADYPTTPGAYDESYNGGVYDVFVSKFDSDLSAIPPTIQATIDIDPDTLNLKSKGTWITAYIELPEGYDIYDVDIETIKLHYNNNSVEAEWGNIQGTVYMVKFERDLVKELLNGVEGDVELKVTGEVANTPFEGTDTIRVK